MFWVGKLCLCFNYDKETTLLSCHLHFVNQRMDTDMPSPSRFGWIAHRADTMNPNRQMYMIAKCLDSENMREKDNRQETRDDWTPRLNC